MHHLVACYIVHHLVAYGILCIIYQHMLYRASFISIFLYCASFISICYIVHHLSAYVISCIIYQHMLYCASFISICYIVHHLSAYVILCIIYQYMFVTKPYVYPHGFTEMWMIYGVKCWWDYQRNRQNMCKLRYVWMRSQVDTVENMRRKKGSIGLCKMFSRWILYIFTIQK